jgi:hypothetical protein
LYLQEGLGESALRAGASYLPMALVFGLTGYHWRRLPAALRRAVIPVGLATSTVAFLALAAGLHAAVGALTWTGLAGVGLGLGLSVSPLLTQSLTHVPATRAADASGLLTTTVQLAQLLGVTAIGSVYLSRAAGLAVASGSAVMSGSAVASGSAIMPGSAVMSGSVAATGSAVVTRAAASAGAMSATACWLAVLSAVGLLTAVIMTRAARRHQ